MRLLHIAERLSCRGGADWHMLGVLEALVDAGHHVELAVGHDDGTARAPCSVRVIEALSSRGRLASPGPVRPPLDRCVRGVDPDVVHLQNIVDPEALAWAADTAARRPVVLTVQDHRGFCPGRGKWTGGGEVCRTPMSLERCSECFDNNAYFKRILTLTERRLEALRGLRLTVLSDYMRRELCAAGLDPARITVIPPFVHGLDTDAPAQGPPCVLFVGRVVAAKGVHDALEAWKRSGVDLPLVFAGTGSERPNLEAAGCTVLGWQSHAELSRLYRRARVVMLPSRWQEPFGIVGLEALTLGCPVAAWDSGGVREWHPGEGKGLVPWGDTAALARALAELATTSDDPGADPACRAPPAHISRGSMMERLLALYERLGTRQA